MNYLGDFPVNAIIDFKWNTNDQTGGSVTRSTDGTLKLYKGNSATERTALSGVTQTEDFDAATGVHHVRIDTSDTNGGDGFWAAGGEYQAVMTSMTIDTKSVNAVIAEFSIERAGGVLSLFKAGTVRGVVGSSSTTQLINTSSLTPSAGTTDQYKGRIVIFDSTTATANLRDQATDITTSSSGGVLTVTALTVAPSSGDTFRIF